MHNLNYKPVFHAIALLILASIAVLWSWNTLSELFNLPPARYKHVLAAIMLPLFFKWGLTASKHVSGRAAAGGNHETSNH